MASSPQDACVQLPSSREQDQTSDQCFPRASELTLEQAQGLSCGKAVVMPVNNAAASSAEVEYAVVNADHSTLVDSSGARLLSVEMAVPGVPLREETLPHGPLGSGAAAGPARMAVPPCEVWGGSSGALSTTQKTPSSSLGEHRTRVSVAGAFALLVTAYLQTQIPP